MRISRILSFRYRIFFVDLYAYFMLSRMTANAYFVLSGMTQTCSETVYNE